MNKINFYNKYLNKLKVFTNTKKKGSQQYVALITKILRFIIAKLLEQLVWNSRSKNRECVKQIYLSGV